MVIRSDPAIWGFCDTSQGRHRNSDMWSETLYHRDNALLYIAYICNGYLGCAYPCWQVALQSVAIDSSFKIQEGLLTNVQEYIHVTQIVC